MVVKSRDNTVCIFKCARRVCVHTNTPRLHALTAEVQLFDNSQTALVLETETAIYPISACTSIQSWPTLVSAEMKSFVWTMRNIVNLLIQSKGQKTSQMDSKFQNDVYFHKKTFVWPSTNNVLKWYWREEIYVIHYHTLDCINVPFGLTKSPVKFCH